MPFAKYIITNFCASVFSITSAGPSCYPIVGRTSLNIHVSSANTVKDFENEPFEETFEKVFRSKKDDHETQWLIQSKFFKLQLGNKYGTNTISFSRKLNKHIHELE